MTASYLATGEDVPESRNPVRLSLFESSRGVVTLLGVIRACFQHPWNPQGPGRGQGTAVLLAAAIGRDAPQDRGTLGGALQTAPPPDPWAIYQKLMVTPRSETINLAVDLRLQLGLLC
jgi:hypothetical protein